MTRIILVLLFGNSVFAESADHGVTVYINYGVARGGPTNLVFECKVTVRNQTSVPLTATNLFSDPPGLALVVRGWYGEELARTYASSSLTSSNLFFLQQVAEFINYCMGPSLRWEAEFPAFRFGLGADLR